MKPKISARFPSLVLWVPSLQAAPGSTLGWIRTWPSCLLVCMAKTSRCTASHKESFIPFNDGGDRLPLTDINARFSPQSAVFVFFYRSQYFPLHLQQPSFSFLHKIFGAKYFQTSASFSNRKNILDKRMGLAKLHPPEGSCRLNYHQEIRFHLADRLTYKAKKLFTLQNKDRRPCLQLLKLGKTAKMPLSRTRKSLLW